MCHDGGRPSGFPVELGQLVPHKAPESGQTRSAEVKPPRFVGERGNEEDVRLNPSRLIDANSGCTIWIRNHWAFLGRQIGGGINMTGSTAYPHKP